METTFIEATNGPNHGKFMLARFTVEEWARSSVVDGVSVVGGRGWTPEHVLIFDLQTGEGALFLPGGSPPSDLNKHAIWVCPLFEPMLEALYQMDLADLASLPAHVELPEAPFAIYGYRRPGPSGNEMAALVEAVDLLWDALSAEEQTRLRDGAPELVELCQRVHHDLWHATTHEERMMRR